MKVIYFDCFSGISGDMILGALIDAGLDIRQLTEELYKLKFKGYRLTQRKVKRYGLTGTKVNIVPRGIRRIPGTESSEFCPAGRNSRGQISNFKFQISNFKEIAELIDKSKLNKKIKETSKEIFKNLARAERKVHGQKEEHFHEVGSLDSIIDVVGAVIGFNLLGIEKIYSSPLILGRTRLSSHHDIPGVSLPIPAPATIFLLKGYPCLFSNQPYELVTPTGAAILATLAEKNSSLPLIKIMKIGYGAGSRTKGEIPNLLRAVIGETTESEYGQDRILVVEASIDDASPLTYEHLLERLRREKVLDTYISTIQMKKTRPGVLLTVLILPELLEKVTSIIFEEIPTLGIRYYHAHRNKLHRKISKVDTKYGKLKVKLGMRTLNGTGKGKVITVSPEYDDCKRIAERKNVPLRVVYEEAKNSARRNLSKSNGVM